MKMQVQFFEIELKTDKKIQIVDITRHVESRVDKSAVANGLCVVHAPHATAAIMLNESESGLISDMENKIDNIFQGDYSHDRIDDNAAAHIASAFIKSSITLPVREGHLVRGTWQNILFVELDGPRSQRKVIIELMGDTG
jgi:secondary thiamine-phosphate synthase enzyme